MEGKLMKNRASGIGTERSYLRARFAILSEGCPFDDRIPSTCPFHKLRKRSLKKRIAWFDELSEEAFLNIYTYCRLCLEVRKKLG